MGEISKLMWNKAIELLEKANPFSLCKKNSNPKKNSNDKKNEDKIIEKEISDCCENLQIINGQIVEVDENNQDISENELAGIVEAEIIEESKLTRSQSTPITFDVSNAVTELTLKRKQTIADQLGFELIQRTKKKLNKIKKLHERNLNFSFGNGSNLITKEEVNAILKEIG